MSQPSPQTGGKRYCQPPRIPWYILIPLAIIVSGFIAYDTSKSKIIEWRDKAKENIKEKREKRMQKRKASEKEILIAAYGN